MSELLIKTSNLTTGYGKKVVVEGLSLAVNGGEIVSLIGPNGAGKTTILRTISGQLEPIAGQVFINGKNITTVERASLSKLMAVVFTDREIKEAIKVYDVVAMGRYPYTGLLGKLSKEDHEIIAQSMEKTNCFELKNQKFNELSDGQRQRVLLARALAQKPSILLLDEPTTFLDIKYTLEFLTLLKRLSKDEGFACVMSLHELDMARQISDIIVCIKDKKIDRVGKAEEVFKDGYINQLFDIKIGSFSENSSRGLLPEE